jgi:hypothetical protein
MRTAAGLDAIDAELNNRPRQVLKKADTNGGLGAQRCDDRLKAPAITAPCSAGVDICWVDHDPTELVTFEVQRPHFGSSHEHDHAPGRGRAAVELP